MLTKIILKIVQETQPNQPPIGTPTPPPPAATATPPPQPRASSLPPETQPIQTAQNLPSHPQSVGSPAAPPRKIQHQLSNSTTSSLDILSSSPDVGQITTASKSVRIIFSSVHLHTNIEFVYTSGRLLNYIITRRPQVSN